MKTAADSSHSSLFAHIGSCLACPPAGSILALALLGNFTVSARAADDVAVLPAVVVTASPPVRLDTAVATGSNLALTPLQIAASVDVLSRAQLDERGDASLVDAITRSPGISSLAHPGNGGSSLSARGFTDTTSVMRLYDGVRQYGGVGLTFPFDSWAAESIEVLRGPASVIHGDGAIGGVVNVIPRKPTRGPVHNEIQVSVGTENTQRLAFGSGGAIDEHWSYRFDASGNRSSNWVDRGRSSDLSFSGALQLDVSPDLFLSLSYAQGRQKPMQYFGTPLVEGRQVEALRHRNYNVADADIDYRDRWTDLSAQWKVNAATTVRAKLYYIDSDRYYRNTETYLYNPGSGLIDRTGNTEIRHAQEQVGTTNDITLQSQVFGLKNQASLGFDINKSTFRHTNNTYTGSSSSVDPFNPVAGSYSSAITFIPRYRNEASQYSVFAEDRLALTQKLSVVAGLRYDHAEISRDDLVNGGQAFDRRFSNTGWRIGAVYEQTPALSFYAQYARAADPVGSMLLLSPANSSFDVSTGKQIEVGVKQSFLGKKGEWTLAAYDIRKNNLLTRDASNPALRVQVGERSSRGIEATLALAFARNWQLDLNTSLLRARYDNFSELVSGSTVSRNGQVPTDVPERMANAWLSWNFQPAWTASAGVRHVGKRFADNANTLKLPAYTTTDMALSWKVSPDTTLTLRGFNVFDKQYFTTAYYTSTQWLYGADRRFELTANHRF